LPDDLVILFLVHHKMPFKKAGCRYKQHCFCSVHFVVLRLSELPVQIHLQSFLPPRHQAHREKQLIAWAFQISAGVRVAGFRFENQKINLCAFVGKIQYACLVVKQHDHAAYVKFITACRYAMASVFLVANHKYHVL